MGQKRVDFAIFLYVYVLCHVLRVNISKQRHTLMKSTITILDRSRNVNILKAVLFPQTPGHFSPTYSSDFFYPNFLYTLAFFGHVVMNYTVAFFRQSDSEILNMSWPSSCMVVVKYTQAFFWHGGNELYCSGFLLAWWW